MSNHNPLTETYSQFKACKFNQGKIDGFTEACDLVERQYGWLTTDVLSIVLMWKKFVRREFSQATYNLDYFNGYIFGIGLCFAYFSPDLSVFEIILFKLRSKELPNAQG